MKSQEPRSSSSCAACKFLKRGCTPNCQFAPYFRSDEPKKFAKVHKVFGASNVSKILNEVAEEHREDAVNSLVFEAEVRLQDPVYGCVGAIASLQHKMVGLQHDLVLARNRLACFLDHHHHSPPPPPPPPFFDDMPPLFDLPRPPSTPMPDLFDHPTLPLDHFAPFHFP